MAWIDSIALRRVALGSGLAMCAALTACSVAGPKRSPLVQEGPNLVEVYRDHIAQEGIGSASHSPSRPAGSQHELRQDTPRSQVVSTAAATSASLQGLDQRFRRLPNPDMVMYVFPHLAKGRYPVPGYFTVFPMYESVEYAMPGETGSEQAREVPQRNATGAAEATPAPAAKSTPPNEQRRTVARGQ